MKILNKSIYEFQDYKRYLRYWLKHNGPRGSQSKLADVAGCQRAFVSQVLQKEIHFSLEHAERINHFLGHTTEESRYFINLLSFARAGTQTLKDYFRQELNAILKNRLTLKDRLKNDKVLSHEDQSRYYSSWIYAAIHMAVMIPDLNTIEKLTKHFRVPQKKILEVVDFLTSRNLLIERSGTLAVGNTHLYISNEDSQMIIKHHTNWRVQTIAALANEGPRDLHYSGVVTLSKDDALALKAYFIQCIEEAQKKIKDSKEEVLYVLGTDFYEI